MISALAALVLLIAVPQQADDPTRAAGLVVDQMHQAAARADGPAYFETFTPDARFIGTDATERWTLA
ncbi:nuclear transport factor 2 family protein, partial [Brevundimonas nasdae]|uniref:nuclear transport factor 2 family protein n=1 Tax=Brevundimonas nasdae TaxID=172043 RepID=UPI00289DF391